jgi:hypothetical protein
MFPSALGGLSRARHLSQPYSVITNDNLLSFPAGTLVCPFPFEGLSLPFVHFRSEDFPHIPQSLVEVSWRRRSFRITVHRNTFFSAFPYFFIPLDVI